MVVSPLDKIYNLRKVLIKSALHALVFGFLGGFIFQRPVEGLYRFDAFTTDNGLPQNGVREIGQTPDGYLWFTTFDGLVRYDGVRFTVFDKSNSPGILSNRFFLLHIEPDGSLYAGTEDGGLTVYRSGAFQTFTEADGLPSNQVTSFKTDKNGEFVIGTAAGNCYFREGKFVPVPDSEMPNRGFFYLSPTKNLFLYDENSIRQITPGGEEITYPIKLDYYNERLSGIAFFEDRNGFAWFGDLSGVYRLKDGNITKYATAEGVPPGVILRPQVEDREGGIWFATGWYEKGRMGLARLHNGKITLWGEKAGISSPVVGRLFKDREGSIWAATDRGLNHLQKQIVESYSVADGLVHTEVYPLLQTRGGDIFIGTTRGLSRFRNGKFTNAAVKNEKGENIYVTSLYEDREGLLVGTADSLYRYENGKLRRLKMPFSMTVWAIRGDSNGNLWLGTNQGLVKLKDEQLVGRYTTKNGLPSDDVKCVFEDRSGRLWFGTYGGLVKLEGEKFQTFSTSDGLASERIRAIYEDAAATLWIGTYDGGLSRFKDEKFFNYTVENGLFNNGVFQILEDDHENFWLSSNRGIFRVNRQELEELAAGKTFKINSVAYSKKDGMLSSECNGGRQPAGIRAADGKLWFPTQDGVAVLNPEEISFNPYPPPVQIESVLVERGAVDFRGGVSLNSDAENLEIRYTGISFIKSDQVKFRYRIEGLNDRWSNIGTIREVYFPSLPAGEYTFHVIAANADGIWNMEGARLKISVKAPFWQRTWFFGLMSAAAVVIIFAIFRLRENRLESRRLAQREFSRKLLESQEQERKRIASELHDSLGQYLLAIKNWALFGLNSLPEKSGGREYLTEVSETSSLALEEVREIAHNLRPYQLERLGLTNALENMLQSIKNSSAINLSFKIENVDNILPKDDEIVFYRIAQECVNNVIKHSRAQNASISVISYGAVIEFACRDDGRGFDVEAAKNSVQSGLGLNGIIERVEILGGRITIDSDTGRGTNVSVKIPKRK